MSFVADLTSLVLASRDERLGCPEGWSRTPLGEVVRVVNGYPFKSSGFGDVGYPVIRIRDVSRGFTNTRFNGDEPGSVWVEPGELLVGMDGDFQTAFWRSDKALLNQRVCKLRPDERRLNPRFLAYMLPAYLKLINEHTPSVTVKHLSSRTLAAIPLALPSIKMQHRIVTRIDELFAEIDDGEAALARARTDLTIWRKSLLKAAVTGELTADWRAANPPTETGVDLLARILSTRGGTRIDEYQSVFEKTSPKLYGDAPLPGGWTMARIGQLFDVFVGSTPSRSDASLWGGDVPWVSSGEVSFCRITDTREKISRVALKGAVNRVHPPGTVMLGMIGEGKTRGQAAILDIEAAHNQNCASIRVSSTPIPPDFVYIVLMDQYERTRKNSSGGNQPALNKDRVNSIQIPLPSLLECAAITEAWIAASAEADAFEEDCQLVKEYVSTLRQSILASAFRGQLA